MFFRSGHRHINQEKTSVNWYAHGARYYDPQLARWHCSDPLAELYASSSPYGYVINNPINFVDPDGMRRDPAPYARDNYTSLLSDGYNRTPFENSFSFMRASGGWYYDNVTQTYSNFFGGSTMSASSFNNDIAPSFGGTLSSEATQAVIDGMNSLIASMSSISGNINMNRSWNLPLVMALGFDNNIFQFDRESGSFYAPWTDIQVDPLAILVQSLAPNSSTNSWSWINNIMNRFIKPTANITTAIAGSKYTSSSFREGYWRGANGKYYPLSLTQKGGKGWAIYQGSANIAKNSVKWIGGVGNTLGYIGALYNGTMFALDPNLSNGFGFGFGVVSVAFWEIGVIYGIGTGMVRASEGERNQIQSNIMKNRSPLYNVYNPSLGY